MREISYGQMEANKCNSHLASDLISKVTSGGSYKLPRSVRKQINSESEEKIWQDKVNHKLIFNPSDMTTPSVSMVPLKRPVDH